MSDVHLATIEALALAIDAKDQTATSRIRRVQVHAAGLARVGGHVAGRRAGRPNCGAAARHRQARGARAHLVEARSADQRRVPADQGASAGRRRDCRDGAVPVSGRADHPRPPRAVGWQGLSGRARGRRHSTWRAHPGDRRSLRRVDVRAPIASRALDQEEALATLQAEAGQAFDPRPGGPVRRAPAIPRRRGRTAVGAGATALVCGAQRFAHRGIAADEAPKRVLQDIALAHREIYALYEIAQSMGTSLGVADTMALISSKLSSLVPFTTCALFLHEENRRPAALPVRHRHRRGAPAAAGGEERTGSGRLGRPQSSPLVNARPSADLEARRHQRRDDRCSRRWSVRWCSTIGSSARWRCTIPSRADSPTTIGACWIA